METTTKSPPRRREPGKFRVQVNAWVSPELRQALQDKAIEDGISLSTLAGQVLGGHVGVEP